MIILMTDDCYSTGDYSVVDVLLMILVKSGILVGFRLHWWQLVIPNSIVSIVDTITDMPHSTDWRRQPLLPLPDGDYLMMIDTPFILVHIGKF